MKKASFITGVLLLAILLFSSTPAFSQKAKRHPSKKTEQAKEDEASAKLLQSMAEPVEWKAHFFPEDGFASSFPRSPVISTEDLSDPTIGKLTLKMFTSVADTGVFLIGKISLPYAITDEGVAKMLREKALTGVAEGSDSFEWEQPVELTVGDRKVLEVRGKDKESGGEAYFRSFLIKKTFYYQMAMSFVAGGGDSGGKKQIDDYFASFTPIMMAVQAPPRVVNPLFKSSFVDGVFDSAYFGFTMTPPDGWRQADESEMLGIREQGRGMMETNTGLDLSRKMSTDRKTLFLFSSKALGADMNFMINCTVLKMPARVTGLQFTQVMESMIGKAAIYKVVNRTRSVRLGKNMFSSFDLKASVGDLTFDQSVFIIVKKGYALSFSATYDEKAKPLVWDALTSIAFRAAK